MPRHSKTIDEAEKWLLYDFWSAALMALYLSEYEEAAIEGWLINDSVYKRLSMSHVYIHNQVLGSVWDEREELFAAGHKYADMGIGAITDADFRTWDFYEAYFQKAVIHHTTFDFAYLRSMRVEDSDLFWCSFVGVDLSGTTANNSRFSSSMMELARLEHVRFYNCQFTGAKMSHASFVGGNFMLCSFRHADLSGADFSGATLNDVDFSHANLTGAIFTGANLNGAKFDNAILTDTCLDPQNKLYRESVMQWCEDVRVDVDGDGYFTAYRTKQSWRSAWPGDSETHKITSYEVGETYSATVFSTDPTTHLHPGLYFTTRAGIEWTRIKYRLDIVKVRIHVDDVVIVKTIIGGRCRKFEVVDTLPYYTTIPNPSLPGHVEHIPANYRWLSEKYDATNIIRWMDVVIRDIVAQDDKYSVGDLKISAVILLNSMEQALGFSESVDEFLDEVEKRFSD